MLFHLITIQNSNSDDIVFHGFDYDTLRLQVAAECRSDWHHGMAHAEPIPLDREEQIEAFFQDHDRLFLIEQEFNLPNVNPRWDSGDHWKDHPGIPASEWQHEVAEGNTRLGYHEWIYSRLESEAEDATTV